MNTKNYKTDKTQENKIRSSADSVSRKPASLSAFQFFDNKPEVMAQKKLKEMSNNSYQVKQLRVVQEMADSGSPSKQAAQSQAIDDNHSARQYPVQKKGNKHGLPDNLKSGIENLSGYSMDDVRVHYNSDQPALVQAYAFAQGTDIHVTSGQEKHLPHEAWHVVQQKQGRVQPTMQSKGISINDDAGLEKEADMMGSKALQVKHTPQVAANSLSPASAFLQKTNSAESALPFQRQEKLNKEEQGIGGTPVSVEIEAENLEEHEGSEGGPGDDDRLKAKKVNAQLKVDKKLQRKKISQLKSNKIIQRARGYVRGAATAAALAITESVGQWGAAAYGLFAPVPRNADQTRNVNGVQYTLRNDNNGWVEFVAPLAHNHGPALAPVTTVDIRPWFGNHNKAIKNDIRTTRYNHFLAANEARAAGLVGYPNNVIHNNADYDNGYDNNPDGGSSPAGLTWHHHGSVGKMELIDRDVHAAFRHSGGYSAWGS